MATADKGKINDAVTDSGAFKPNPRLADAPKNAPGNPVAGAKPASAPVVSGNTASEADGVNADGDPVDAEAETDPAKAKKAVPGYVTFKHPDGSTTTNEVDDIANIPPHKFEDVDHAGEIVEIKPK
jgi:hypothetical protein